MTTMLETPSRIWRRIEAVEDRDMPSLPSLSPFEDSSMRRRSFLLDIINSTARPRMKFPTPHPRKFGTPSITESTPCPEASIGGLSSPALNLQSAFMGVTYRRPRMVPTRRKSHPLSQTISASSHGISESEASPISAVNPVPQALTSPNDGTSDRASFISTVSSHDLTTHHRVNTSFDPAMGFGTAPGHGVGRFNAAKLNNYLHGLNQRLQQENEDLTERLKILEEKKEGGANRSVSSVRMSLGNVQEDVAEGWLEEKAELEDMVEKFKTGLTTCMAEKKELETVLEQEKESRERDNERWRERMTEVEQGVSGIIAGLEQKLDLRRLEIDDLRRALDDRTNDLQRAEKEKDKIATEKSDVARTVASLEADLKRIRRDAEAFGQDLKLLRKENDKLKIENRDEISKAERSKKQAQTQVRQLNEELKMQKENVLKAREEIKNCIDSAYVYGFC